MAFEKVVAFVNNSESANDGKIYLTIQDSDAAVGPFDVFIDIQSPSDPSYYVSTNPVPDMVLGEGAIEAFSVDIPIIAGEYEAGEYIITIEISGYETNSGTYEYTPNVLPTSSISSEVVLSTSVNCSKSTLTCKDLTDNAGYVLGSPARTLTVNYPNDVDYLPIETDETQLKVDTRDSNGRYLVNLEVYRQKFPVSSNDILFIISERISNYQYVNVSCLHELLKLKCLFVERVRDYVELKSYGISCDEDFILNSIKKLNSFITMYDMCANSSIICKRRDFINKQYDDCAVYLDRCKERTIVNINSVE